MKQLFVIIALLAFMIPSTDADAQVLSETTKRKFSVGVDVFTDIWQYEVDPLYMPAKFSPRTINQGATVFFMYNMQLGESLSVLSAGLAIRNHNMYTNSVIINVKSDTIVFNAIDELPTAQRTKPLDYQRSKINLTYLDLPIEFKYRSKGGFKLGVGFKVGYLIDSKQKYVGEWPVSFNFSEEEVKFNKVNDKSKRINQLEKWAYGVTLRVGYKWISVFGYYQFSKIFETRRGPSIYPVSVGISISPF